MHVASHSHGNKGLVFHNVRPNLEMGMYMWGMYVVHLPSMYVKKCTDHMYVKLRDFWSTVMCCCACRHWQDHIVILHKRYREINLAGLQYKELFFGYIANTGFYIVM